MEPCSRLLLDQEARDDVWRRVLQAIESHARDVHLERVAPRLDPDGLRAMLAAFDFEKPLSPEAAVEFAVAGLREHQVHVPHPGYYGLFNPAPTTMGIVADTLVAAFNPQLAAWSHSPFAAEVERHVVVAFGERFGYERDRIDGTIASGGMEANHTAVLTALTSALPEFREHGVRAVQGQPVLYVSAEGHDSFRKAARLCGLGAAACRRVPVDSDLRLDPDAVRALVAADRRAGRLPFLLVPTAGTTSAGVVDPIAACAAIAAEERLWLHVDAAWGGAAILLPEFKDLLDGIAGADSITLDAHKWFSVPMGAGVFITRHTEILERTFSVRQSYMPTEARDLDVVDPFAHSMQWSRRFAGLKIFLSLAVAGWDGYAETIRRQTAMGDLLRRKLAAAGWEIFNSTPLPVVCFVDGAHPAGRSAAYLEEVCRRVLASGKAWISVPRVGDDQPVLRACVTNYRTAPGDLEILVDELNRAREALAAG